MNPLRTVARAMLAAMYIDSGWRAYRHPERLADQAKIMTDRVAPLLTAVHPKAPTDAQTLVKINGAAQIAGGVLLATGKSARPGALLLAATTVPTTLAAQPFWQVQDPTQRARQRTEFLRNLSMLGGLLVAGMDTGGKPGLAWRTGDLARKTRKSVSRTARDTSKAVSRTVEDTSKAVSRTVEDTSKAVKGTARDTRRSVNRLTGGSQKSVRGAVQETEKAVLRAAKDAQRSVSRAANVTAARAKQLTGS